MTQKKIQPNQLDSSIETTTQLNTRDTANRNRTNHTGTQAASTVTGLATVATSGVYADLTSKPTIPTTFDGLTDGTTNKAYTATEKTKLAGIATAATANSTNATLLARANHTGTQAQSTVTNLTTDLAAKQNTITVGTTAPSSPVLNQLWVDTA